MKLIRFAVTRKITISMLYVLMFLLGFISWNRLPREFMPNLEFPQLTVLTNYENASSQEVENLVTKVIEEACGTVKGVRRIHSVSKEGISIVTVEFIWGINMDFASLNMREKIDLAKAKLPRDAGEPQIEKFNPFAMPVMIFSLTGNRPPQELLKIAKRPVSELMEKVPGVAAVSITGGIEREIEVELKQSNLANYDLPILKVADAIDKANITYPAGTVKDETYEYVVRVMGAFNLPKDIENVVVKVDRERVLPSQPKSHMPARNKRDYAQKSDAGSPMVMLSALGTVKDTFQEPESFSRYDGRENVSLSILKQGEANVVEVADATKKKLEDIKSKLPDGVDLKIVYDQSVFIKNGIGDMVREGLIGALLSFLVLYIFLGSSKDALVVSAVIPSSIAITILLLYINGITLNTISLSGLVVGIGLLADGAIVIIENIARHKEKGETPRDSAIAGATEVIGAVVSSGGTQIVVFLPLIFVVGVIGQVFKDFSLAIVFTHASLLVYFTLLPMLAGLKSKKAKANNLLHDKLSGYSSGFNRIYDLALCWSVENPLKLVAYAVSACVLSVVLLFFLPKEIFPKIDQGQFIASLKMPVGTKLEITNRVAGNIESALQSVPEVEHMMTTVGSVAKEGLQPLGANESQIVVDLREKRRRKTGVVIQDLKKRLENTDLSGGKILFTQQQSGSLSSISGAAGGGSPIVVEVQGYDLNILQNASDEVKTRLKEIPGAYSIASSLNLSSQEIGIDIDRDSLALYGLSVTDIANTMLLAVKGKAVSKFREEGKEIDIRVRLSPEDRNDMKALNSLLIRSPLEMDVALESVATLTRRLGPSEILHYDQQRTVLVTADLFNKPLSAVRPQLEKITGEMRALYPDLTFSLTGEAAQLAESYNSLKFVLFLSLLLVYMIMAAQFESFWKPLLIMFTIPLALIGLAPALLLTGNSISVIAGVGMVLLCGITVNNGIVLIDFANQEMARGVQVRDAIWSAAHIRLRPIMITVCTTVLGLLPVAVGFGKEAQMQSPMAIVVIFGFIVSTCLTLLFLPAIYVFTQERLLHNQRP
ncbi:MAG: efflux RND transporter permease subunit [Elusimicrobiota bacterium]